LLSVGLTEEHRRIKALDQAIRQLGIDTVATARLLGVSSARVEAWLDDGTIPVAQLDQLLNLAKYGPYRPGNRPTVACLDRDELETAVSLCGGPTALARRLAISPLSIHRYRTGVRAVDAQQTDAIRAIVAELQARRNACVR
jgi:DNA-binding transcriptional regulator YdaS (Cro superfamily)